MPTFSRAYGLLIILILVWGLTWPLSKIGLQYMPALWFVGYRLLIGTISMFVVVMAMRKLVWPHCADLPLIFTMGIVQIDLFMTFINLGLQYVDAGRSAILVYTTPLWVMPLAILFFGEKAGYKKWLGFFLGMLGVVVLFGPWAINWSDHKALLGNGFLLLAALCWAVSMLCARHMHWTRSPLELIPWQLLVGTVPVMLLAFFAHPHVLIQWQNHILIMVLLYSSVLGIAFAYWGTMVITKELPSVTASLSFLGVPVSGLIFSAFILHEPITLSIGLAMLLIISGLVCVALEK